jgi:hypothetical protein
MSNVLFVCVTNSGRSVMAERALEWADVAVSTCSEEVCPVTPGVRRISWVFEDLDRVREIRDEIEASVERLVHELDAEAAAA